MKQTIFKSIHQCLDILFIGVFFIFFISCINNISDEDPEPEPGNIPISISSSFNSNNNEYINYKFNPNDALGLYVVVQPATLEQTRYIDNIKFIYDEKSGFIPQEVIYFPEGKNSCDFISYFPYQKNAIGKGDSKIAIEIQSDQTNSKDVVQSDFMIATHKGITASEKPVKLEFNHKLFCIHIQLEALSGYTPEMLLESNPSVKIKDVYTKATYDFTDDSFTNFEVKADITPNGTWEIKNEMLCGKSAIIIPQTLSESHAFIELCIDDRLFECKREANLSLESGIYEDNTITLYSSDDAISANITVNVNDWNIQENTMNGKEVSSSINISTLTFKDSNVYKVLNRDKQVAEICLEYLCTDEIDAQAIVIYPTINGKTDLSEGFVAEIKGETENRHRGSVSWDINSNVLNYTSGTSSAATYIYISDNGEIRTTRPEKALQLQAKPDVLVDNRGTENLIYPIVKIGTQYWTRTNLKTIKYTDGTNIEKGSSTVNSKAQYYTPQNSYFFYNAATITDERFTPNGWRICTETDLDLLIMYVKGNAAVLKNGESWLSNAHPITNLTGFNSGAPGYYNKTYINNRNSAAYWSVGNKTPILNKMFILSDDSNKIESDRTASSDMALTVRYIRN